MNSWDCIVIGAGHAGLEAALAAGRMGCRTALVTFSVETIGQMSCNPAIGGVGKGQLVKEVDALGGEMGLAADVTGIQFRQLNASKGQAVRSSRCQSDRKRYRLYMQNIVSHQPNVTVLADEATDILVQGNAVVGLKTASGQTLRCQTLIVATGTFLNGRIHRGKEITPGGRIDEPASVRLTDSIKGLGLEVVYFKTGTPPRLDGRTIDFSKMETQHSDETPAPFSFRTPEIPKDQKLLPCFLTRTTEKTHDIIRANFHLSPMYSGQIQATGVRYCPSIEDKLKKFPDKTTHHVFLEPEGLDTDEYYPNGISTGLPKDVQEAFVRTIPGLEKVRFVRYGYSIEHGVIPPTSITAFLEAKTIRNLFLAGQINGTTGYEEAAAQGILAGINAALRVRGQAPFILGREESYIGVLVDDLTTKGTEEPYRMFTSRVEYRLIVREDNADRRLSRHGFALGLLSDEVFKNVMQKYDRIDQEIQHLRDKRISPGSDEGRRLNGLLQSRHSSPIRQVTALSDILKRPEMTYAALAAVDGQGKNFNRAMIEQIEYEIKYEGFIHRQRKDVEKFRHIENICIPDGIEYAALSGLSKEIQQKLRQFAPRTLGQALRISGVTPAAVSILMVHLRKLSHQRQA